MTLVGNLPAGGTAEEFAGTADFDRAADFDQLKRGNGV
jgi:hypothetical protein